MSGVGPENPLWESMREAEQELSEAGIDSARLDAQVLAGHAAGRDRSWALANGLAPTPPQFFPLVARRKLREPLAYILGSREFYGRSFAVTQDVLIPRQETETLVDAALELPPAARILDIGTGSGCLAITLALEIPGAEVTAVDVSKEALEVAKGNAFRLGAKVEFLHSDLGAAVFARPPFDLIVSNPPYVAPGEISQPEVADWEPKLALYSGTTGLDFYLRLAMECVPLLSDIGHMVVEVGDGREAGAKAAFEGAGWQIVSLLNDLSGLPRALVLARNSSLS